MRAEIIKEHYRTHRPFLHFSSNKGWINDPNGLIFYQGEYHLFYQYYPDGVTHGVMHWGHAKSRDLISWEELPIALFPDDKGEIFSGCMVYDKMNTSKLGTIDGAPLIAVFTHHRQEGEQIRQYQSLAFSLDGGQTFQKYEGNPVLDQAREFFRDPKVFWHSSTGKWVMLLTGGREICFFGSDNLVDWEYLSNFSSDLLRSDEIWECPDIIEISDQYQKKKWVLFVSQNSINYEKTAVMYYVGDFDGYIFRVEQSKQAVGIIDFGRDNYAAATYAEMQDRVIQQSWMNCWLYAESLPESGFRGSMTMPREISLRQVDNGYVVLQKPARELYDYVKITEVSSLISKKNSVADNSELLVEKDNQGKIYYRKGIDEVPAIYRLVFRENGGKIILSNRMKQFTIKIDFRHGMITVERCGCINESNAQIFREIMSGTFHIRNQKELYLLLDVTSIEIFAAEGEICGTFQYFIEEPFENIIVEEG